MPCKMAMSENTGRVIHSAFVRPAWVQREETYPQQTHQDLKHFKTEHARSGNCSKYMLKKKDTHHLSTTWQHLRQVGKGHSRSQETSHIIERVTHGPLWTKCREAGNLFSSSFRRGYDISMKCRDTVAWVTGCFFLVSPLQQYCKQSTL